MVIKQEGETNTQPKCGDTLVKQGDMQGAVVGYTIVKLKYKAIISKIKSV